MNKLSLTFLFFVSISAIANASGPIICTGSIGSDSYNVNIDIQSPTENSIIEVIKNNSLQLRIQGEGSCGVMLIETQHVQDSPNSRPYKQTRIDAIQNENCSNTDTLNMNIIGIVLNQRNASKDGVLGIQLKSERQPEIINLICK